jgi:hypothetical protein
MTRDHLLPSPFNINMSYDRTLSKNLFSFIFCSFDGAGIHYKNRPSHEMLPQNVIMTSSHLPLLPFTLMEPNLDPSSPSPFSLDIRVNREYSTSVLTSVFSCSLPYSPLFLHEYVLWLGFIPELCPSHEMLPWRHHCASSPFPRPCPCFSSPPSFVPSTCSSFLLLVKEGRRGIKMEKRGKGRERDTYR